MRWQPARPLRFIHVAIAFTIVYLLCIAPLLVANMPPLHDYPFHIARMDILALWHDTPSLQNYYNIGSFILPNIGMDAIVLGLSHVMNVEIAGRVFVALTILLQLSGCVALHYQLYGRHSLWPLAAAVFVYNWIFLFAFLNYLFGLGLVLWATTFWLLLAERRSIERLLLGTLMTSVLFFCHLIACGLFAVIIAGYELHRAVTMRRRAPLRALGRLVTGAAIFIVPAVLFALSPTAEGSHITSHKVVNLLRTPPILVRVLLSGNWIVDGLTLGLVIISAVIIWRVGRPLIDRSMRLVLVLLGLTFLVMPHELFGGWGADTRIPVLLAWMLIASLDLYFWLPIWSRIGFFVLLGFLSVRAVIFSQDWISYNQVYDGYRTAFRQMPNDSVLFMASEYPQPSLQDIDLMLWQPPLAHVASLATLVNPSVFVATTWATAGQQPITPTSRYAPLYAAQNNTPVVIRTSEDLAALTQRLRTLCRNQGMPGAVYLLLTYPHHYNVAIPADAVVMQSGETFQLLLLHA